MPGQNGTGPSGMGSRTGRGTGMCAGTQAGAIAGNGRACRGRGRGLGRCGNNNMAMAQNPELSQKESLVEQKEILQAQLAAVNAQLEKV